MVTPNPSTGTRDDPLPRSSFAAASSRHSAAGTRLPVLAAAAAGPMVGTGLVLLSKPLGGSVGLPGAVAGYIVLTAAVLGTAAVLPTRRWNLVRTGRRAGIAAMLAGAGALVAGLVPAVAPFTIGLLVAGTAAGPLLVYARAVASVRVFHVLMSAGAITGALAAQASGGSPGMAPAIGGGLALAAGTMSACTERTVPVGAAGTVSAAPDMRPATVNAAGGARSPRSRWSRSVYGAIGFGMGGTVLPALHLLLFRWNVLDADQPPYLVAALVAALIAAAIAGYHAAPPWLPLILVAGGALLAATAPGGRQLTVGVALGIAAAVRATAVVDEILRQRNPASTRYADAADSVLALAAGALAGLGFAVGLGHVWGTGTALTLLSVPVLAVAAAVPRIVPAGALPHGDRRAIEVRTEAGGTR